MTNIQTYRAKRPLKMGLTTRNPGELVPEASTWLRVDNSVHSGFLAEVYIPEEEFAEAVNKYCPELAEKLESIHNLHLIPVIEEPASSTTVKGAVKAKPVVRSNK